MRISIVTPVYNDPRIRRALDSIAAQHDAGDVETIVIDGGSSSPTQEILRSRGDDIDVLVSEPDAGIYDAMNKGVARATGDIVGVLNADDAFADSFVLRDVRNAFQDPGVGVTYGDVLLLDAQGSPVRYWRAGSPARWKIYFGWMPPHPGSFVRRQLYERHGPFRLDLPIAADYEHQLRLLLGARIKPHYIPRVLVHFALGGQSSGTWRKVIQGNTEVRRAWRINRLRGGLLAPVLKPAQKLPQYARARSLARD